MESVEDIPAASILEGLAWDWETYGEYLAAIDRMAERRERRRHDRPLRGAPLRDGRARPRRGAGDRRRHRGDDRPRRRGDAARARSASRPRARCCTACPTAGPCPARGPTNDELLAIADVLGRHGKGVYEVAPRFERPGARLRGHARRDPLDGRDQPPHRPARHVRPRAEQRRARAVPQDPRRSSTRRRRSAASSARRPPRAASACCSGCSTARSSTASPAWAAPAVALARRAPRRARRPRAAGGARSRRPTRTRRRSTGAASTCSPTATSTTRPTRRPRWRPTRSGRASRSPRPSSGISVETRGRALFNYPFLNQRMDAVEELLDHPRMAIGLGDSGAHVGLIMDASLPTWFLSYWVRDRGKYPVERRGPAPDLRHRGAVRRRRSRRAPAGRVRRRQRDRSRRAGARASRVRARLPRRRGPLRATRARATVRPP